MEIYPSVSPELSVADRLDNEIADLRARTASLKLALRLRLLCLLHSHETTSNPSSSARARSNQQFREWSQKQSAHKQQCLYRACAGVTTFKIQDPDPNAVDGGNLIGLRFEVMSKAKFLRPYYVMLNRPYATSRALRVHRHTVPQCIPLASLAARYLAPPIVKDADVSKKQDLSGFARALRRELVRYHNRAAVIGDMKKAAGLASKKASDPESDTEIVDISAADAEARQISLQWRDGRSGRLIMNDDGEVMKMVVQGNHGQDRETVQQFLDGAARVEDINKRLDNHRNTQPAP
ncbi:cenp-O kinetochore centromere component [Xylaria arbuscula]|nr:cenp-O kinetochore centromere component [Xylaria arbuscula]